jgi:hypothetical protein
LKYGNRGRTNTRLNNGTTIGINNQLRLIKRPGHAREVGEHGKSCDTLGHRDDNIHDPKTISPRRREDKRAMVIEGDAQGTIGLRFHHA